jgi:hypothetical protein
MGSISIKREQQSAWFVSLESIVRLEICVASHCTNCGEALAIAQAARDIASLDVAEIDFDQENDKMPDSIVAVPTYRLNGRVVSLGYPEPRRFLRKLRDLGPSSNDE